MATVNVYVTEKQKIRLLQESRKRGKSISKMMVEAVLGENEVKKNE